MSDMDQVIRSAGQDVPGVVWTVLEVPDANLVSLAAVSSPNAQGETVVRRSDRKASVDSLNFPLFVDSSVGLAHVTLSSRLSSRVIRDLESPVVFTVNNAEVSQSVRHESPFLVEVAVAWPDDKLASLMWIPTCIQRQVACLCQGDSVPLVSNWIERALVLGLVSPSLLTLLSLTPTLLSLLSLSPALLAMLSLLSPALLLSLGSPSLLALLTLSPTLLSLLALLSPALLSLLPLLSPTLLPLLPRNTEPLLAWDSKSLLTLLSLLSPTLLTLLALSPALLSLLALSPTLLPLLSLLSPALSAPTHLDMFIKL